MERVVCVSAKAEFSMVLTAAGTLFSFGNNACGQLGLGRRFDTEYVPCRVAIDAVKSVSAESLHVAAITTDGALWSWGCNQWGQLGHDDGGRENRLFPIAVAPIADLTVKQVSAGFACTMLIDADDTVWMAGQLRGGGYKPCEP